MIGLAPWELEVVSGPWPVLVRRECILGIECSDVDDGGCLPGREATARKAVSEGNGELDVVCRGPEDGS